jgi:septal ring factor EnvC (AmiA/AmiB activator)
MAFNILETSPDHLPARVQPTHAALWLAALLALSAMGPPARAQSNAGGQLLDVQKQLKQSTDRKTALGREIKTLNAAIAGLREKLIATATRIQTREAQASFIEERLGQLNRRKTAMEKRFAAQRTVLAELLAGLQRLERNPPPALVVKPDDAVSALRGAMLMGNLVPEIRNEANALARSLSKLTAIRDKIGLEQKSLKANLISLDRERVAVRKLLLEKRKAAQITKAEIDAERIRLQKLAREAGTLKDLIARLGPNFTLPPGTLKPGSGKIGKLRAELRRQAALLKPVRPFSRNKGNLAFPAQGMLLSRFGHDDGLGGTTKGLTIATRANAQVITPIDGHVVYSGSFRSYGQVLIINAGEGYHVLLAGMQRISVSAGQFVLAGEPIGIMGEKVTGSIALGGADSGGKPVLYVEFRKNGSSINPDPWWAGTAEKARG